MNKRVKVCFQGAAAVAVVALLYFVNPVDSRVLPPCFFHVLTGLHCPGCGSTRALHCLVHGDVVGAVRFNPLVMTALMAGAILACWRRGQAMARKPWFGWSVVTVVLAFGILRNIPAYPFVMLKP